MKREDEKPADAAARIVSMLGVGFDNDDGEVRLTRGENFSLIGGSQQTHEVMQETAIKVNERFQQRGKRLEDASREEFMDTLRDVMDSMGADGEKE